MACGVIVLDGDVSSELLHVALKGKKHKEEKQVEIIHSISD